MAKSRGLQVHCWEASYKYKTLMVGALLFRRNGGGGGCLAGMYSIYKVKDFITTMVSCSSSSGLHIQAELIVLYSCDYIIVNERLDYMGNSGNKYLSTNSTRKKPFSKTQLLIEIFRLCLLLQCTWFVAVLGKDFTKSIINFSNYSVQVSLHNTLVLFQDVYHGHLSRYEQKNEIATVKVVGSLESKMLPE